VLQFHRTVGFFLRAPMMMGSARLVSESLGPALGTVSACVQEHPGLLSISQVDMAAGREFGCNEVLQDKVIGRNTISKVKAPLLLPTRIEVSTRNVFE